MPAMSKIANTAAILAAAFATQAAAHTYVKEFEAGGKTYAGFYAADKSGGDDSSPAWRTNQGWGFQPVMGDQINDPNIIAHMDAEPSPFTAPVDAGSDVKFTWQHDGECGGQEVGWDCSHHGWTATWLAPCNGDCKDVQKENLSFFKIHQAGLINYPAGTRYAEGGDKENTGYWGTDAIFYDNGNSQTVTIPKDLPSGNYVLRTEVASVHNNGDVSQRQFWPQALNIAINNGNDNAQVPSGIKATEIYSSSDPQLTFDLYQHEAGITFDAPGPAVVSIAGGSASSSSADSGSAPSAAAEAEVPSSTAAPAAPVESSYAAQPTPEASSAAAPVVSATATATQPAYVIATAPAVSSVAGNTTAPAATPAPGAGEGYQTGDNEEEADDEEGEGDDEEDDDEDYSEDDDEDYSEGDDEEEGSNGEPEATTGGYHGWGEGKEHWRSHARSFFA
ncbi:hypothetical protein SLS60_003686 [Paraconiothyrium brasiliense]|uniref:Auxiliary Activity family 9 catalytic domain-containing protein n=1 Tax=Paraconiothyrium brasiliense TaxID=300254 RepID=A0ABR3RQ71_9PLEO